MSATSDTPFTLPTFNVGQRVTLTSVVIGFTPSSIAWVINGPMIKDYDERVGTLSSGQVNWSTTPVTATDLTSSPISFYWKPDASQIHPLNGGPVSRNVSLTATVGSTTCVVMRTFSVDRNAALAGKTANDFYTSNHRAPMEMNPAKGLVIDYHQEWHAAPATHLSAAASDFFVFHRKLLARFDSWRSEFGYPPIVPWYPGNPIPALTELQPFVPRNNTFLPDANRLPQEYTIAGVNSVNPRHRLADFTSLDDLDAIEFSYHGQVHCNVGHGFGALFGDMCLFSSPKDPIFWRWHKFIDVIYANFCGLKGLTCAPGQPPPTDVWMADNAADLAAGGTVPSQPPHYISPDIWNRTAPATCTPPDPATGVIRSCGSSADHENPVAGQQNYLYATIRNDRPGATMAVYVEAAVYIANASLGLAWPTNFGGPPAGMPLPETRQFITLNLTPGQHTDIGPVPWTPPSPLPSDHWCMYIRVLSTQTSLGIVEGPDIDANTGGSNSIAWRNVKIVNPAMMRMQSAIVTVRNLRPEAATVDVVINVPKRLAETGQVELLLRSTLLHHIGDRNEGLVGLKPAVNAKKDDRWVPFVVVNPLVRIKGIVLRPREESPLTIRLKPLRHLAEKEPIRLEQYTGGKLDGGTMLIFEAP